MMYLNLSLLSLMVLLTTATMACSNDKKITKPSKETITMPFPQHPGTIKMVTRLDNTVEIEPISEIPEMHQFVYYDLKDNKVDKEDAVRAVPIIEVHMSSMDGGKLVPTNEASYLYTEMFDSKGNLIDTHTMWRDGIPGGKRKTQ